MKAYIIFTLAVATIFSGCVSQRNTSSVPTTTDNNLNSDTTSNEQYYWLAYHVTQCNDRPWQGATEETIAEYYEVNESVVISDIKLASAPRDFVTCQACGCPTGETLYLQVDDANRDVLLNLGFIEDEIDPTTLSNFSSENELTQLKEPAPEESVEEQVENDDTEFADGILQDEDREYVEFDTQLQQQATAIQAALAIYYDQYNGYPASLTELDENILSLSEDDLLGITYTPIGTVPSSYYDLRLEYSTGAEILNP